MATPAPKAFYSTQAEVRNFADLPEPPKFDRPVDDEFGRRTGLISDPYLTGLEKYIAVLGHHTNKIQLEEAKVMQDFQAKLKKLGEKSSEEQLKEETDNIDKFKEKIQRLRRMRREYREMTESALQQRQFFLDSMILQKEQNEYLRGQLYKLSALPKDEAPQASQVGVTAFSVTAFVLQVVFIILFAITTRFESFTNLDPANAIGTDARIGDLYNYVVDLGLFVLVGLGFLLSFLRKYSYSAVAYTLLLTAMAVQWSILVTGFFQQVERNLNGQSFEKITLNVRILQEGFYGAVTVLITFGALAGKVSIFTMFIAGFIEIIFYGLNMWICGSLIGAIDVGRSMYIHIFGAVFGLSAAIFLSKTHYSGRNNTRDYSPSYLTDLFAMIGTVFLFVLFPSFNSSMAVNGTQYRVAINTILSICASVLFGFLMSRTFRGRKFDMAEVQNASIAGGVGMASSMSMIIEPGAALIVGSVVGVASAIGFAFIQNYISNPDRKMPIHDSRGVFSFHFIPALIAMAGSIIATATVAGSDTTNARIYGQAFNDVFSNGTGVNQSGLQAAALVVTFAVAAFIGVLVGIIFYFFEKSRKNFFLFSDESEWQVPSDFERSYPPEE